MKEAVGYIEMSIDAARKSGMPEIIRESEKSLSDIYNRMGKPAEALEHYKAYISVRDILNQNVGVQRNFYNNVYSEEINDRLKRYFMIGFTWDFKNKSAAPPAVTN